MLRLLLTDDEAHVRQVMSMKLTRSGYEVITASNGAEALDAAREIVPDLVVTDMQMPRMNGLELARALASDPCCAKIPVIMVTSRQFEIGPEQTKGTNVQAVMSKPFSPSALVNTINKTVERLGLGKLKNNDHIKP